VQDDYLTLAEAAKYVGVNRVKFSRMAKKREIPTTGSPFDERMKLFRKVDLDALRQAPRPARSA
jgi:excisionase family DNA binding protein